jgi:hypothetical protein
MQYLFLTASLAVLLACGSAHAAEPLRIDASSDVSTEATWNQMIDSASPQKRQQLRTAMVKLNLAGIGAADETSDTPQLQDLGIAHVKGRISGLTADEIIDLASRPSTASAASQAQAAPVFARAGRIAVPGTTASFESPAGFTALTVEEIASKYPGDKNPPSHMVGNERRTATVAFGLVPLDLTDAHLPQVMEAFSASVQGTKPSLKWVDRKLIHLDGQRWICMELTSNETGNGIHSILLMTPHAGAALVMEFSASQEEFSRVGDLLRASLDSIRLTKT